jgi:hypothetical protein
MKSLVLLVKEKKECKIGGFYVALKRNTIVNLLCKKLSSTTEISLPIENPFPSGVQLSRCK